MNPRLANLKEELAEIERGLEILMEQKINVTFSSFSEENQEELLRNIAIAQRKLDKRQEDIEYEIRKIKEEEEREWEQQERDRKAEEQRRKNEAYEREAAERRRTREENARRSADEEAKRQAELTAKRKAQNEENRRKLEQMQAQWQSKQTVTPPPPTSAPSQSLDLQTCPNCGNQVTNTDKFCSFCGTKLLKVCSNCGASLNPSHKFCTNCGTPTR